MQTDRPYLEVLDMPDWKSRILRAVASLLGYRGQYVYCVVVNNPIERILESDDQT